MRETTTSAGPRQPHPPCDGGHIHRADIRQFWLRSQEEVYAYYRLARREERQLLGTFGKAYAEYQRQTPMFIPRFSQWRGFVKRSADDPAQSEAQQEAAEEQQEIELTADEKALDAEERQAMEQWLRRIKDDPGGLMRRKFLYQYHKRNQDGETYDHQTTEDW